MKFNLVAHPGETSQAVSGVEAAVHRDGCRLTLSFTLLGDIGRVVLPPGAEPGRADGLWAHTCLELFIAAAGGAYYEFNFSPSGQWAAYRFDAYREGRTDASPAMITGFGYRAETGLLGGHAQVDLKGLPGLDVEAPFRIGLSAVIEEVDARKTYWALAHAPGKPDFHHPAAFAGEIASVVYW